MRCEMPFMNLWFITTENATIKGAKIIFFFLTKSLGCGRDLYERVDGSG